MYTDAFGRRHRFTPRLRFIESPEGEGGGGDSTLGFPAETSVAEMTPEQQAAYWKHQSKAQQKARETAERERDTFKPKADQFDQLEQQSLSDQEKALNTARDEARREGEVLGAGRYLKEAVKGRFQALTGKSDEEVETAFAHVDAQSFATDGGDLDLDAIKKFADTFGSKAPAGGDPDPVRTAIARMSGGTGSSGGNAGSVADIRQQRLERLQGSK